MSTKVKPLAFYPEEVARRKSVRVDVRNHLVAEYDRNAALVRQFSDDDPTMEKIPLAMEHQTMCQAIEKLLEQMPENMNFHHDRTEKEYFLKEKESVLASCEMERGELLKDFPATKETFLGGIYAITGEALGMKSFDRANRLAERDKQESKLIYLESLSDKALADIARFRSDPTPDNFNTISGTLGLLRHELTSATAK